MAWQDIITARLPEGTHPHQDVCRAADSGSVGAIGDPTPWWPQQQLHQAQAPEATHVAGPVLDSDHAQPCLLCTAVQQMQCQVLAPQALGIDAMLLYGSSQGICGTSSSALVLTCRQCATDECVLCTIGCTPEKHDRCWPGGCAVCGQPHGAAVCPAPPTSCKTPRGVKMQDLTHACAAPQASPELNSHFPTSRPSNSTLGAARLTQQLLVALGRGPGILCGVDGVHLLQHSRPSLAAAAASAAEVSHQHLAPGGTQACQLLHKPPGRKQRRAGAGGTDTACVGAAGMRPWWCN